MDTLISNVTAVTMNERMDVLFGTYIGITDGKISYIGKKAPEVCPVCAHPQSYFQVKPENY